MEESSVQAEVMRLLYSLQIIDGSNYKEEFFYLCNYISGIPTLSIDAIENTRIATNNYYKPIWIPIEQIDKLTLYPLEIRDLLIEDLKTNFLNCFLY